MSQPLVITVENNDCELAKIYYHWGAYTVSALDETQKVVKALEQCKGKSDRDIQLALIRFCENSGGGIDRSNDARECEYIQKHYPDETFLSDGYNRNRGLIAISETGMYSLQAHSCGDVYINIEDENIDFCHSFEYESLEEYNRQRKSWDKEFKELASEEIPEISHSLYSFKMKDAEKIFLELNGLDGDITVVRHGKTIIEIS